MKYHYNNPQRPAMSAIKIGDVFDFSSGQVDYTITNIRELKSGRIELSYSGFYVSPTGERIPQKFKSGVKSPTTLF